MLHDSSSPGAWLASLPEDWRRETVIALRGCLLDHGLTESIGYGMLRFSDADGPAFHLNAQKHHVALYAGDIAAIDPGGTTTAGFDLGKGCIRIRKSRRDAVPGLARFIARALQRRSQGLTSGC